MLCNQTPLPAECNNPDPNNGWGFRPQRGCLQPNGPPGTPLKIIARADLLDNDPSNDDIGARFVATLSNISVMGSAIERGLDAVQLFLDPETDRHPSCANDLDSFLRPDAKLITIFLTDEEDCSRQANVGACENPQLVGAFTRCEACNDPNGCDIFKCPDDTTCNLGFTEFQNETCGNFQQHFEGFKHPSNCYDDIASLTPVSKYVDFMRTIKPNRADIDVAVIAGGLPDGNDFRPAGCKFNAAQGDVPVGGCFESKGSSNTCEEAQNCCFADPGARYYEFAEAFGGLKDTICVDSFAKTMINIAVKIGDVEKIDLAEEPEDLNLMFVEKAPAGSSDFELVTRLAGTGCEAGGNGWVLEENNKTIRLCGAARPLPGERIRVRAKGAGAESTDPDACANR